MKLILTLTLFLVTGQLFAQSGTIDSTFNVIDQGAFVENFNDKVSEVYAFPSGKYLVAGDFTSYRGTSVNYLVMLDNGGEIDPGFTVGNGPNGPVNGVTVLNDGRILVYGFFDDFNGTAVDSVVRLMPTGVVDPNFQMNTSPIHEITDIAEVSNGDLIVSGGIVPQGIIEYTIMKFDSSGNQNTQFNFTSIPANIQKVYMDDSDDVFIVGSFNSIGGYSKKDIAKMDTSGSIYAPYTVPDAYSDGTTELIVEAGGSIVACGTSGSATYGFFRALPDGSIDPGFANAPWWGHYRNLCKDGQGRYYLSRRDNQFQTFYRLKSNGEIDSTYHTLYYTWNAANILYDATIDPSGKLVSTGQHGIFRRLENGAIDPVFNKIHGANGVIDVVKALPNGKIMIGGDFSSYNGHSRNGIARLHPNGEVDITFQTGAGFISKAPHESSISSGTIRDIEVQADGKIVVGGSFSDYDFYEVDNLIRLNVDGSPDSSFVIGTGMDDPVNDIIIRPDNKIVIAGDFYYYDQYGLNPSMMISLGVLLPNGTPDPGTNIGSLQCTDVSTIALQDNGQLLVGGISSYNFQSLQDIVRINPDGTRDNTFSTGSGYAGNVYDLAIQSDGKIVVGSDATTYGGVAVDQVSRLHSDGSLDVGFNTNNAISAGVVRQVEVTDNGKIFVLGELTDGTGERQVARLFATGLRDNSFHVSNVTPTLIHDINSFSETNNKGVLVGGTFRTLDQVDRNYITRLKNDTVADSCSLLSLDFTYVESLTCGDSAEVSAHAVYGYPPYTYSWDGSVFTVDDTTHFIGNSGIHNLDIIDSIGCSFNTQFLVSGPVSITEFDFNSQLVTNDYRPGFEAVLNMDVYNDGCASSPGVYRLQYDTSRLSISTVSPTPDMVLGDTLVWNFSSISYDSLHFTPTILFVTDTTAQIGDSIVFTSMVEPIIGDYNTTNNTKIYKYPIVNGYDPNDKKVFPEGECIPNYIEHDQKLTYTVRFQNTGNSEAININIIDSLPQGLDIHSLRVIATSDPMYTEHFPNNIVHFRFDNINLPDSTSDPLGSIGYVIFELDQEGYNYPGTEIRNKAGIYFDFNPPIITNEVLNTVATDYQTSTDMVADASCDSVFWEGNYYDSTGIYSITYPNIYGCDSTLQLNLTFLESTTGTVVATGLDSIQINNQTYTSSGIYYQTLVNAEGCDSLLELNLTIGYTGFEEKDLYLSLTPNPTKGSLHLAFDAAQEDVSVKILTNDGRLVEEKMLGTVVEHDFNLPYSAGVYYIVVTSETINATPFRIIKE